MICLEADHPYVHRSLCEGHHVIRRSEKNWAGLSTDLIIEQVLMHSVKIRGGLIYGRGFSESHRTQWLLSMPTCSEDNLAMQTLWGVGYVTSKHDKDVAKARQKYMLMIVLTCSRHWSSWIRMVVSDKSVVSQQTSMLMLTVQKGRLVILDIIVGLNINELSFRRKYQVVSLAAKTLVTTKDVIIQIELQLLFQKTQSAISK